MIGRLLRSTETAISLARFFGGRWRAGLPMETPDQRAEAISKVTAEQVQRLPSASSPASARSGWPSSAPRTRARSCSRRPGA